MAGGRPQCWLWGCCPKVREREMVRGITAVMGTSLVRYPAEAPRAGSGCHVRPAFGSSPRWAFAGVVGHRRVGFLAVYRRCMSRTNIDIDEEACQAVMDRYHLSTKRAAVNFALRTLAAEPLDLDSARRLRGSGWDGDLDDMRTSRTG